MDSCQELSTSFENSTSPFNYEIEKNETDLRTVLLTCMETHMALQKLTTMKVIVMSHCFRVKFMLPKHPILKRFSSVFFFFFIKSQINSQSLCSLLSVTVVWAC